MLSHMEPGGELIIATFIVLVVLTIRYLWNNGGK